MSNMCTKRLCFFVVAFLALGMTSIACQANVESASAPTFPSMAAIIVIRASPTPTSPIVIIGDGGLLSGEPCGPPCFWGIEPGKTTYLESIEVLTKMGLYNMCRTTEIPEVGEIFLGCPSFAGITFRQTDMVVESLGFEVDPPIELQDIIIKYGPPDAVGIVNMGGVEIPSLRTSIYYFKIRTIFSLSETQENWEYKILPTSLIDGATYVDQQYLIEELDILGKFILDWKGYGIYRRRR